MPTYKIIRQDGPVHVPTFTIHVHVGNDTQMDTGKSIKDSEKDAARKILKKLDQ